ncbi:MAG: hypothetical protein FH752_08920 [Marinobacter adhaerens]|uniref:Uncharacterized protein n=1 Tax=Marinobacter adhaerens TaxID=1033846 RepID=A0A844HUW5_9GAMM|nr:hypothetical protein [Marinobacter adhaerens]
MDGILGSDIDRQALEAAVSRVHSETSKAETQLKDLKALRRDLAGLSASIDLDKFPAGARVAAKKQFSALFHQLSATRAKIDRSIDELEELIRKLEEMTEGLDLATTTDVLDLCSDEGLDSLVIPLCKHPISRRELKRRIQFASEIRDIATAAQINFEALTEHINDPSALLKSCIAQTKTAHTTGGITP